MRDFFKKVMQGDSFSPSEVCLQSFHQNFEDAINVEWVKKEDHFEAVFYRNNLEHIAVFSLMGILTEYRQNLPAGFIPEPIRNMALTKGEIMNAVMRNKGNLLEYELILRDQNMTRYLTIFSDTGSLIEEKKL